MITYNNVKDEEGNLVPEKTEVFTNEHLRVIEDALNCYCNELSNVSTNNCLHICKEVIKERKRTKEVLEIISFNMIKEK